VSSNHFYFVSGEQFLTQTSELLGYRGAPKLSVGGACTSVAVDLGDLEGRGPDVLERWNSHERTLNELLDWQTFRQTSEQVGVVMGKRGVMGKKGVWQWQRLACFSY